MTREFDEYMFMADVLFNHLRNGTANTPEEEIQIAKKQEALWELMTEEERLHADDTILRTVISIKAERELNNHE